MADTSGTRAASASDPDIAFPASTRNGAAAPAAAAPSGSSDHDRADPAVEPGCEAADTLGAAAWSGLLERALDGDGFDVHFQPIVDLLRGAVVGYEALARFDGYPVSDPLTWFQAAHRLGYAGELQSRALRQALEARTDLPADTFLAVNVGPEVLDHPAVQAVWHDEGQLDGVVVELTEHARVASYDSLREHLDHLRGSGALIALDDAGAGYAGLRHIVGIRPQVIKLDRHLIEGIDQDETKQALVEMIGSFASRVRAEVLAEGIEAGAELDTVVSLGITLAQGYLLARPQEPWPELDAGTHERLLQQEAPPRPDTVQLLVEQPRVVRDRDDARAIFAQRTGEEADTVVFVDSLSRPVATVDAGGVHVASNPLHHTAPDTSIATAARRAVARIPDQRFRPVMCVDTDGRLLGVVRVERLVDYLADATSGPADRVPDRVGGQHRSAPAHEPSTTAPTLSGDSGSGGTVVG
jgi:EAL domain-containing protein (putative c-di-GMP-specific phosphodiesterase class I)